MLANAYLPRILAMYGAGASLVLAVLLEIPALKLTGRIPWARAAGWVLLANLVSAVVGMVPVFRYAGPGMKADPWEVYQSLLPTFYTNIGFLFGLTLISEGMVYLALNWRAKVRLSWTRLLACVLVCNLLSYSVLAWLMLGHYRVDMSDRFFPDTAWFGDCQERVWFVEAGTHRLCSIRLDGKDRRVEIEQPLGRVDVGYNKISPYAICPGQQSILFVASDMKWHVSDPNGIRSLGGQPQSDVRVTHADIENFSALTSNISVHSDDSGGTIWANIHRWRYGAVLMFDEHGDSRVTTMFAGGGGSGNGLKARGPNRSWAFRIPAGPAYLACTEPAFVRDGKLVLFRCSAWIMVMDMDTGRVGRLVEGDSLVAIAPAFKWQPTSGSSVHD